MESIAVTKPDMRIERQETLSPFGFLNRVFTEELIRRNHQSIGYYRPLRLAYLEEETPEAAPNPPEIHFDLDVDLIVNRLLRAEKAGHEKETPARRILEKVILREKEIRIAYPETRRLVIENAHRRIAAEVPLGKQGKRAPAAPTAESRWESSPAARQDGEGRSRNKTELLHPSAALARLTPVVSAANAAGQTVREKQLTLASRAMSVPAAGGWTPTEREAHPGYPGNVKKKQDQAMPAGSILLPDVMRRRREEALARKDKADAPTASTPPEEGLSWLMEGTEQTPETERVFRDLRRAVSDTIRRNLAKEDAFRERTGRANAPALPEQRQALTPRGEKEARSADRAVKPAAGTASAPTEREYPRTAPASGASSGHMEGAVPGTASSSRDTVDGARTATSPEEKIPGPVSPDGEQASPSAGTPRQEAGGPARASHAASSEAAPASGSEAAPVYREGEVAAAPREETVSRPVIAAGELPDAGPAILLPTEEMHPASPAELVYREEGETAAPETAAQPGGETIKTVVVTGKAPVPGKAEQPQPAVSPTGEAAVSPVQGKPRPATEQGTMPTALPREGETQTAAPAELVYREEGETAAPETAAQSGGEVIKTVVVTGKAPGKAERPEPSVSSAGEAAASPAQGKPRPATEQGTLPTALPREGETQTAAPAELVYREESETAAPETAARPGGETIKTIVTTGKAPVPGKAEWPEPSVSSAGEAAVSPAQGKPHPATEQGTLPTALPREGETQTAAPAELVYREEGETAAPEGTAQPGGETIKTVVVTGKAPVPGKAEQPQPAVSPTGEAAVSPAQGEKPHPATEQATWPPALPR